MIIYVICAVIFLDFRVICRTGCNNREREMSGTSHSQYLAAISINQNTKDLHITHIEEDQVHSGAIPHVAYTIPSIPLMHWRLKEPAHQQA